jgi:hypothetical protein
MDAGALEELASYRESLRDLTQNSKPHINMLTMLAEENFHQGSAVVSAIEDHILQVFMFFLDSFQVRNLSCVDLISSKNVVFHKRRTPGLSFYHHDLGVCCLPTFKPWKTKKNIQQKDLLLIFNGKNFTVQTWALW